VASWMRWRGWLNGKRASTEKVGRPSTLLLGVVEYVTWEPRGNRDVILVRATDFVIFTLWQMWNRHTISSPLRADEDYGGYSLGHTGYILRPLNISTYWTLG